MGLLRAVGLALSLGQPLVAGYSVDRVERRQDAVSARYCDADQKTVCYAQFTAPTSGTTYRIAIPEVAKAPFDTLVQVVAPNAVGWAALAWGGSMAANPLTVAWMADNNQGVVSSRWATGHTPPTAYTGATYTVLSASKNSSHWQVNFLCSGCSTWGSTALNPNGVNKLAYATSNRAPATPGANTSSITIHSEKGSISQDLSVGKVDSNSFRRFVLFLSDHSQQQQPQQPQPATDNVRQPADPPTSRGRIPTTIIRATPTAAADPDSDPPVATSAAPPVQQPTQRPGSPTGPVRTSITTVPRPTTAVTQRPVTVTVTVTQGGPNRPPTPSSTQRSTARTTTSCYRREGGSRVCTSVPAQQSGRPGSSDDDDDEDDSGSWWGGGSSRGGGSGGRFGGK